MIINVHGGHNARVPGARGLIDEVTEDRRVKDLVLDKLRSLGHTVHDCTDNAGASPSANLANIVAKCNAHKADLDVSIHFNAGAGDTGGNGKTTGAEVLVYSGSSKATTYAAAICARIADLGFKSRGVKERPDLYVLKHTTAPALLVECCFVDDADDVALYDADQMAAAIVQGITGQAVSTPQQSAPTTPAEPEQPDTYPAQFQSWLNVGYGAGLTVDGLWGPKTRAAAIKALQSELNAQFGKGLAVDGLWGPKTKAACVNVKQGASGNLTRLIQGTLYCRGYNPKGFDGIFGAGCAAAVRAFQTDQGLSADGIVGKNTWAALMD